MKIPDQQESFSSFGMEYEKSKGEEQNSDHSFQDYDHVYTQSYAIQIGNIKITKRKLLIGLLILALVIGSVVLFNKLQQKFQRERKEEQEREKQRLHKELVDKNCYKSDELKTKVFYVVQDLEEMPKAEAESFQQSIYFCSFQLYGDTAFNYFVDLWNQREQQIRYDQSFINKTALTKEERRILFIWLKLYFRGGIYIHPSLGTQFGKYLNDRYLFDAHVGKQILFAKYDHQNEKGIYVPERDFKTVKVDLRLSQFVRKMIQKIAAKGDWMDICENYQCIIIKDANSFPQEL